MKDTFDACSGCGRPEHVLGDKDGAELELGFLFLLRLRFVFAGLRRWIRIRCEDKTNDDAHLPRSLQPVVLPLA